MDRLGVIDTLSEYYDSGTLPNEFVSEDQELRMYHPFIVKEFPFNGTHADKEQFAEKIDALNEIQDVVFYKIFMTYFLI